MDYQFEQVDLVSGSGVGIRETHPIAELSAFFGGAFGELAAAAGAAGVHITGAPFAQYYSVSPEAVDVEVIFPVSAPPVVSGRVHAVELPGGKAIQTLHIGPYEETGAAYEAMEAWLRDHGRVAAGPIREVYLNGPETPPAELRTLIVQPVAST